MSLIIAKMVSMMIDPFSIIVAIILIVTTKKWKLSVRLTFVILVGLFWSSLSILIAAKANGLDYYEYMLYNLPLAFTAFMLLFFIVKLIFTAFYIIKNKYM